jgi:hypothetical protein
MQFWHPAIIYLATIFFKKVAGALSLLRREQELQPRDYKATKSGQAWVSQDKRIATGDFAWANFSTKSPDHPSSPKAIQRKPKHTNNQPSQQPLFL